MKVKMALGLKLNSCLYAPRTIEASPSSRSDARFSDADLLSSTASDTDPKAHTPTTPTPSSSGLILAKHSPKSSKNICAICLGTMKPGHGHAIFTAECSHSFHFHCITSNVKHGKQCCPVCRSKWKEIPLQSPATDKSHGRARINNVTPQYDAWMPPVRRVPSPRADLNRQVSSLFHTPEPAVFNDDDEVACHPPSVTANNSSTDNTPDGYSTGAVEVKAYPEVSSVPKSKAHNDFSILIHLKAPATIVKQNSEVDGAGLPLISQTSRAPVDLVTVLDVSGSMAGTKLALLKRAMGFVIQNLGPSDRLSVIAFSSTAKRLFPLRRMTDTGRYEALQAVNSLSSNGGTNIAEGLRKGAKVLTDHKWKNPVSSIILLSDGQDTYTVSSPNHGNHRANYQSLLPDCLHIPVHTFGFGADHDADAMHLVAQNSGGTFSFIEAENVIQDAFAQCIGGLLSVVVQELKVEVVCINPALQLTSIKSGSYKTILADDKRKCFIEVGDLYAEEERDFLVTTDIPVDGTCDQMPLINVKCIYKHTISKNLVTLDNASTVVIERPVATGQLTVSMEVDRQRNRLQSAEAMAEARAAAEQGDLPLAASILEKCRRKLSETVSAQAGDRLCVALDAELRQMQERMANQHIYETSGRAYVLSGLSSHSWQRATARGDSTDSTSLVQSYQTQSMVDMVNLSQTMVFGSPPRRQRILRPMLSFPARRQPQPR